jgi:hypothetical protein
LRRGLQQERPIALTEHHSLKGALSSAEIVMLRACLSEDLREKTWQFVCALDLYETARGEQIGRALVEAFGESPPTGKSADWLHRLEPDHVRQMLSDLTMDFRSENLTEERLIDALKRLRDQRDQRKTEELRRSGASAEDIFARIKARKGASHP